MKKLRVTVEGKVYEVLVELLDEPAPAVAPTAAAPSPNGSGAAAPVPAVMPAPLRTVAPTSGDVPSPLAGKIVSIDVKVGDAVTEGAQVATVEAMKMNTYIFAPKAGHVTTILVNPGDGVEEGTVLLRVA